MLAKLFNMCLRESCFPDRWTLSYVVPVFKVARMVEIFKM